MRPKLILDVMGGDLSPSAVLEGAARAFPELQGDLVLVGDEAIIRPLLSKRRFRALTHPKVSVVHAPDTIEMEDSIRALRRKPNASINVGCQIAAKDYRSSAFVSAGHSGAVMASALLTMGRLSGIERPAIAIILPTLTQEGCVVLDVGANVDCKPEHLRDFSVMGALFAQAERVRPRLPRVGVLSNGEERGKGNELTRSAREQIEKLACFQGPDRVGDFVGYIEGKDIFTGDADVVVTDGFVGNVVLKSLEGLGSAVIRLLKREAKTSPVATLGFVLATSVLRRLKRKLDYAEYGAAPLLGVAGYVFICHGRSKPRAIKNALLRAQTATRGRFVERLETALKADNT